MIVPMKKIHLILRHQDVNRGLESLRQLGVLHVEHQQPLTGHVLENCQADVDKLTQAIMVLKGLKQNVPQEDCDDWNVKADEIVLFINEVAAFKDATSKREALIKSWEPWGDFNPRDIEILRGRGFHVQLCERSVKEGIEAPEGVVIESIFTSGGVERFLAISEKPVSLPFDVVKIPHYSLSEMQRTQELEHDKIRAANREIREQAKYLKFLQTSLAECLDRQALEQASKGMRHEENLMVLKGFCPKEHCAGLETAAAKENWGLLVENVEDGDEVPTLLQNSKMARLSQPALDMVEILPGYNEVDVSRVFIIFFTIFFGMLIGDAAYGLIFLGLTFFAHQKFKSKLQDQTPFHLLYVLNGATVVWGVLTGTYFGQAWLSGSISPLVPWLNDSQNLQWLCFTIALAHLTIARLWSFKLKLPSITAVAELGWLLIVWAMYYLANMFVLGAEFPKFALWFLIVGIPLAFFFMVPFNRFLKEAPMELIPFVLNVIGAGTDIVSYIRLFAVGVATVAVADAANGMWDATLPMGLNYFLFFFLHLLNMVLAAMAILVHAVRLNVLEFSGHLNLEWAGLKYSPFKKLKQV